jgi:hypothetical protein
MKHKGKQGDTTMMPLPPGWRVALADVHDHPDGPHLDVDHVPAVGLLAQWTGQHYEFEVVMRQPVWGTVNSFTTLSREAETTYKVVLLAPGEPDLVASDDELEAALAWRRNRSPQ